ncbi:antibiotic biosynthesis monooxygenase [Allorhizobium sp. BGMRC 0089]|uniref:putative quinol monooxygenase n=1 Tax=Allorhizobium sonneratiae TaxID=2934936 RepID=UPI0020344368|nr:putative quinol monooxygenase [Allorhizobium sonneratiae]MCM2292541.1 antibiotic biosynthesis monooxygenase [Allorhizobium sonneratiae]
MIIVTGYMHVDPADLAAFRADLKTLALATRQREGNISYDAALDDRENGRLLIVERWADQAALTAHLEAEDTLAFVNRWRGRMRGDIRKYDASNERELGEE